MRIAVTLAIAALPVLVLAQEPKNEQGKKADPNKSQVEVTGCVKGSTLTETNQRMSGGDADENPTRRWRLRGSKALMNQIKEHAGDELQIVGTTKTPDSGMVIGSTRIGKARVYVGGNPNPTTRDPLPEQPTIDVESFTATGETCR